MAYIYSSNSPYYLDYLADNMSREEILADPELCQLLENPYLKDNMELALRYHDAKTGGYEEKKDFVEYMYANGPEIDTDTLMYYREKCYQDQVYLEIAELEFNDLTVVDLLRESKYGKKNDMEDCFTQPCNYLGPLSASIGIMGDSNNFRTCNNVFSQLLGLGKKQKEEDEKAEADKKAGKKAKDGATKKKTDTEKEEEKDDIGLIYGHIRQTLMPHIVPLFQQSYAILYNNVYEHMKDFADECNKAGIASTAHIGDPVAIPRAEAIDAATKVNIMHDLGDCARIWEQMRRYNPYDLTQNQKKPMGGDKIKNNKSFNGAAYNNRTNTRVRKHLPKKKLQEQAASGDKSAEAEMYLRDMEVHMTPEDLEIYQDSLHTYQEKLDHFEKLYGKMWEPITSYSEEQFFEKFGKTDKTKKIWEDFKNRQQAAKTNLDRFLAVLNKRVDAELQEEEKKAQEEYEREIKEKAEKERLSRPPKNIMIAGADGHAISLERKWDENGQAVLTDESKRIQQEVIEEAARQEKARKEALSPYKPAETPASDVGTNTSALKGLFQRY